MLPDAPVYDDAVSLFKAAEIDTATARGVDVFTEKPAARTTDELRPVLERVRDREAMVCPALSGVVTLLPVTFENAPRRGFSRDAASRGSALRRVGTPPPG